MNKEITPEEAFDGFLFDIYTTALEGGINYWSTVREYTWKGPDGEELKKDFKAVIEIAEDLDDPWTLNPEIYTINRSVMLKGYEMATSLEWVDRLGWSTSYPPKKEHFFTPPRYEFDIEFPWDFDAGDADIIVQLGLLGDVVYG